MKRRIGIFLMLVIGLPMNGHAVPTAASSDVHPAQSALSVDVKHVKPSNLLALDLNALTHADKILPALESAQVIVIGESHDDYSHHLAQLELIKLLWGQNPRLAIGLEMFQQPFQDQLDAYVAGTISERELLINTQWYERWSYDYRLYRPILQFARERGIPLLALNVSTEIVDRVSEVGLSGLTDAERVGLPEEIDTSDPVYRERLKAIYQQHDQDNGKGLDRFVEVQLLWDEAMAQKVADWLQQNVDSSMVVLAGSGHLRYGSGIPQRVTRRTGKDVKIILPATEDGLEPGVADFIIYPTPAKLPKIGKIGIFMQKTDEGVEVSKVVSNSAADKAGVKKGDIIQQLGQRSVTALQDVRVGLINQHPGEIVQIKVMRKRLLLSPQEIEYELTLGE